MATLLAFPTFAQTGLGEQAVDPEQAEQRGFDHLLGRGVQRDFAEAARWLEPAASAGRPYAAAALASLYQYGQGVPLDRARSLELARGPAALGVGPAQALLGFQLVISPRDLNGRDPEAALLWLNAAAEQEEPSALFLLGQMYRFGDFVAADRELSVRLTVRAAELGHAPAGAEAALYLLSGEPAAADVQRALHFLQASASSGYGPGAYRLGKLYLTGRHLPRDHGLAVQWLTRASELELHLATLWLAELYAKGLGVEVDERRVAELRERSLPTAPHGARNEFAWELSVSPAAELRNGAFAVEIMEGVTAEQPAPAYLDTLAAAYAEAGRFDDAVRAQQRAVDALPAAVPPVTRAFFSERVELYRSGKPYREVP